MENKKNDGKKLNVTIIRIVTEFYPLKGGSVTHVIELIKAINPYVQKQIIIAPQYNEADIKFDKTFCVPVFRLSSKFFRQKNTFEKQVITFINIFYYALKSMIMIKKITRNDNQKNNKIIIHVHNFFLGEFLVILSKFFLMKFPIVIMQHGNPMYRESQTKRGKISRKFMCLCLILFKPDYYLNFDDGTINPRFVDFLTKHKIKNKVVNHAIDTEFFKPGVNKKTDEKFIILSNHRLDNFKRIDLAIKIFKLLLSKAGIHQNISFKIIGNGPRFQELKHLVTSLDLDRFVRFYGEMNIEDMKKEVDSADIVMGTSLVSNFNRSIQEAMACKKAVIIFKSGKIDEIFVDRENIIFVAPMNLEEFAEKIQLLWENRELREKIGNNARSLIVAKRNWDNRIQQEMEVYRELLT